MWRNRNMLSLAYSSTATTHPSDADLLHLLTVSRENNRRHHITGMLLYREGRFLQVLEGPDRRVRDRMKVIAADSRHTDVSVLLEEHVEHRQFAAWSMAYEPLTDINTDSIPGYRATFKDLTASPTGGTQMAIRQLIGWFHTQLA